MQLLQALLAGTMLVALAATNAAAGDSWVSLAVTSDREPNDFGLPASTKFGLEGAHTFDNRFVVNGLFELQEDVGSHALSENLEGTLGYVFRFNNVFSLTGRGGVGEHFEGQDFPYYVFYVAADLTLTQRITWNAITFRYRDAFDPANDYNTPQLATGLSFRVSPHGMILTKLARTWKDGSPDDTEVGIGYKYGF